MNEMLYKIPVAIIFLWGGVSLLIWLGVGVYNILSLDWAVKNGANKAVNTTVNYEQNREPQHENAKEVERQTEINQPQSALTVSSPIKFYFVGPEEGYFMTDGRHDTKSKITPFEFEASDQKEATFRVVSDETTIDIFKRVSLLSYGSACIFSNTLDPYATKVETTELGRVSFDGENWKVERKAKIVFS